VVHSHSTNKDEHGSATGDAVLARLTGCAAAGRRQKEAIQNQEESEEEKEENRKVLRQARGSNTTHVLGADDDDDFPNTQAQEKGRCCPVIQSTYPAWHLAPLYCRDAH